MRIMLDGTDFDGEYEFDLDLPLTNRELHIIKKVAGVRAGELEDALGSGDSDVVVAMATIALVRSGKVDKSQAFAAAELLMDVPASAIAAGSDEEAEEDPPPAPSESGATDDSDASTPSS